MPVTLNPLNVEVLEKRFHGGHRRGLFEQLHLTPDQKSTVVYRKLESLNPDLSDTFHPPEHPWVEEFTGMPQSLKQAGLNPRIFVSREGGEEGALSIEDGLILTFHGKCAGLRSIDDSGNIIKMEQAEEVQEMTGAEPEQWNLWEFRIVSLVRTDGPQRTEKLLDTEEDKRTRSESGLIEAVTKAFTSVTQDPSALNANTMVDNPESATDNLVQTLASMNPDKREALFQMAEIESEDGEAEPLVNKTGAKATNFKKKE